MAKKSKTQKKVIVNRKFLLDLASSIYNPKNRKFLRLCTGTLQNGPDPTNSARPMHCGLGELYYAMCGKQPEETGIDEDGVTNMAVELSPLWGLRGVIMAQATKGIKVLDVPEHIKTSLIDSLQSIDDDDITTETDFRAALDGIPDINDDGCKDDVCTPVTYRDRAKRVAEQLRKAASFLPK